ncbi:MAG: cytochrome c biogenesis protein CcdA [Pyrinomonadaceae bacterium]
MRPFLDKPYLLLLIPVLLLTASITNAQEQPTRWSLDAGTKRAELKQGDRFAARVIAEVDAGWHLYALDQPSGGPIATTIKVSEGKPFEITGPITPTTAPTSQPDPNFVVDGKPLETKYFENRAEFRVPLRALADSAAADLSFDVRFQLCNDRFCLPPRTVRVTPTGFELVKKLGSSTSQTDDPTPDRQDAVSGPQLVTRNFDTDLWSFIWLAATLGALSLLTPCVFPMIPITVSYFTNHSSGHRSKAVRLATVYSLGIIATFTLLGMLLAIFVGAAGVNLFAANPWVNLLITAIFLLFAFNLFGAYEINVPTGLLTALDRATRSVEGEGSGLVGALLMGLTFTLTSFTCTSPFVGTILVSASQGDWQMPLVGMLAFSTVFALPFFVLALVPQMVAQLPRAGGWMNSVKVTMGFLEIAAAMKFLSNVDLVWKWGIFTRSAVLAIWISIGVILSLYLLGRFQLSLDSKPERIGAVRLVSAILSLAVSFYLLTGLFGAKLGELEAFLPPDLNASAGGRTGGDAGEKNWIVNDYNAALERARAENKKVFVDFTGYTCTNCRWMEANIFPRPEVAAELDKFVLARLYTDGEGEVYERQQRMEEEMFGTVALPFYAVVDSSGTAVGTFPGLTRDAAEFVDFLQRAGSGPSNKK